MKTSMLCAAAALFALLPACSTTTQDPAQNQAIRAALDASEVTLRESVPIAESSLQGSVAVKATFLTRTYVLSVGALSAGALQDVRVDPASGAVLSTAAIPGGAEACDGSVSLAEAIAAAEAAVGGEAVVIQPDDDGDCNREVKVLDGGDILWEVKVAPDGSVIEEEEADDADETDG
jgi:hypothetical protein